jgi:putative membrane protein
MTAAWRSAAAAGLGCAAAAACQAHVPDAAPAWSFAWRYEPWVVVPLLLSAAFYALGVARLWTRAGPGRGVTRVQAAAFAGGWLALAAALVSPIDGLGGQLFSAHMLQHEMLMVLAAPLLCLAQPLVAWTWALAPATRQRLGSVLHHAAWRRTWQVLSAPLTAWALHAAVLWAWHAPPLFELALHDEAWHAFQHASFFASALLFWWAVLRPGRRHGVAGLVVVFTTMMHTAFLGALLSLSARLWYPSYQASASALGFDPMEDQQLGGLLMWVPAGLAYLASGLALATRLTNLRGRHDLPAMAVPPAPPGGHDPASPQAHAPAHQQRAPRYRNV